MREDILDCKKQMRNISVNMNRYRDKNGLTLMQLAQRCGMSLQTIKNISGMRTAENGIVMINLLKLTNGMEMSVSELIGEEIK